VDLGPVMTSGRENLFCGCVKKSHRSPGGADQFRGGKGGLGLYTNTGKSRSERAKLAAIVSGSHQNSPRIV